MNEQEEVPADEIEPGGVHPIAPQVFTWVKKFIAEKDILDIQQLIEAFSSVGLSGNRLAAVCGGTLRRIVDGEPVSDRYVMGLAWTLMTMDKHINEPKKEGEEDVPTSH